MSDNNQQPFQFRRGSKAAWEQANPTLALGEVGLEYSGSGEDLKVRAKFGDGLTPWNTLPYFDAGGSGVGTTSEIQALINASVAAAPVNDAMQLALDSIKQEAQDAATAARDYAANQIQSLAENGIPAMAREEISKASTLALDMTGVAIGYPVRVGAYTGLAVAEGLMVGAVFDADKPPSDAYAPGDPVAWLPGSNTFVKPGIAGAFLYGTAVAAYSGSDRVFARGYPGGLAPDQAPVSLAQQNALNGVVAAASDVEFLRTHVLGSVGSAVDGDFIQIQGLPGIVEGKGTDKEGVRIEGGPYSRTKRPVDVVAVGEPLYWDPANKWLTNKTVSGGFLAARAVSAASGSANVLASLLGRAPGILVATTDLAKAANSANGVVNLAQVAPTDGTDAADAINAILASAKNVYIPSGVSFTVAKPLISTVAGQTITGDGGAFVATAALANASLLSVRGNGTTINGVVFQNPTQTGVRSATGGNRNIGVYIEANNVTVNACKVDRFQNGIIVSALGEFYGHIITSNIVSNVAGCGAGPADLTDTFGEDRGDGICTWGALATISNNIVYAMPGSDARIGIHCEALPSFAVTNIPLSNKIVTITGNVVYGPFRRGIVDEAVAGSVITGNVVADATWWGIAIADVPSVVCNSNSVYYTRPATDRPGEAWAPVRSAMMVYGATKGTIDGNVIHMIGAGRGINVQGVDATRSVRSLSIAGNTIIAEVGAALSSGISVSLGANYSVRGNIIEGVSGPDAITLYGTGRAMAQGNQINGMSHAAGKGINIVSATGRMNISGNQIQGCAGMGIQFVNNTGGGVLNGNELVQCGIGIEFYGSTNTLACMNSAVTCTTAFANIVNGSSGNIYVNNQTVA